MTAKKILIVEDNPALLRGLKDNFQAQGYQVRTANDGEKGLDALLRDPPDLLLLDLMLPKVNGYEICRLARSHRLNTPIIMLSARTQEDDVVRGLELGADDYVTKPFGIRELITRARRLSRRGALDCAPEPRDQHGPLTPARSPSEGERGNRRQVSGEPKLRGTEDARQRPDDDGASRTVERLTLIPPLPKGEGRGEGEQAVRPPPQNHCPPTEPKP
jgi:DNA-binding response OmpR family regulator